MRYHPHTQDDVSAMLAAIGADSIEALFTTIPADLRFTRSLGLPPPLDEAQLLGELEELANGNHGAVSFLGAGAYPHHVPPAVDQLLLRSEFYTAYTPYQPEMAQGTLQAIFEFQTYVCLLTGTEVANASMYDGATAAAEAVLMALRSTKGPRRVVVAKNLHPEYRKVIRTYLKHVGAEVVEAAYGTDGRVDQASLRTAMGDGAAAVVAGYPNFFGVVEDVPALAAATHAKGGLLVTCTTEALSLGLLQPPGALGADVCVGEMQSFGNALSYGGPGLGFFATREEHLRQLPGRIAGETVDKQGRRGFVLTLSTREQHIRREKATSNICTNNGLNALAATIHLSLLGRLGLQKLALLNYRRVRYLREELAKAGIQQAFAGPVFNEVVVRVKDAPSAFDRALSNGIVAGLRLAPDYPELSDCLLLCATELHSRARIDALVDALSAPAEEE